MDFKNIAVIGLGTIGHAVARHFAPYGYSVTAYDIDPDKAEGLQNVKIAGSLEEAARDADYVIENIWERLPEKQALFAGLERLCKPGSVFASNTSSLRLGDITADMTPQGKARAMLCHWFNPGHIIPLVELSHFGNMPEGLYARVEALYLRTGKKPVRVLKDIPGLIANRLQHAVAREIFHMLELGVASAGDLDAAMTWGPAFRYAAAGPLRSADFNGLDVFCAAEDNILLSLNGSAKAPDILRDKVRAGKLGFKSGEGFYEYPEGERQSIKEDFERRLKRGLQGMSLSR